MTGNTLNPGLSTHTTVPVMAGGTPRVSGVLSSATPVVVPATVWPLPCMVYVSPGAGCTVSVEHSFDGSVWKAWPPGTVGAYTEQRLESAVAYLRFTRVSGAADSTYGVF